MLRYLFTLTVLATVAISADPCTQKLDSGKDCNKNSTIKYYFDEADVTCYPFKYNGCAGNLNTFDSEDACFQRCHPEAGLIDGGNECPGGPAIGACNHGSQPAPLPGQTPPPPEPECPKGSYCQSGHPISICCSEKLRDDAEKKAKANEAKCPKGKKVHQVKVFEGYNKDVRGKKCEHDFCPKGSKCVQKKTAFCCL